MNKQKTNFSLKDQLFNRDRIGYLAKLMKSGDANFAVDRFIRQGMRGLDRLELKQRIDHLATVLEDYLPADFRIAAKQIQRSLPPPLDPTRRDDDFGDFIIAPLGRYVVRNGLDQKHLSLSLQTLHALTQRFSMEDAIRAFINEYPDQTWKQLEKWSVDKNYHVRRLVSEGTRPRLPWSGRLTTDAARPLPLLDTLHADSTRYVTRSVANHLNDIAKFNPDLVIQTLQRWKLAAQQDPAELQWITKHSLRTLIKQGHRDALMLLGHHPDPKIVVSDFKFSPAQVCPGDAIEFSFKIDALRDEVIVIDYVIDFVKANGQTKPKVHKLKTVTIQREKQIQVRRKHPFRAGATTLTFYPGMHRVTLQINGTLFDHATFEMRMP